MDMKKGPSTRDAIVDEAMRQASRVGLEGISLAPLADSLSLSKSGLFAHFKSKEALQLVVVQGAIERFTQQVVAPAARVSNPAARLTKVFDAYMTWIRGTKDDGGCLFMTMAQEYDDRPGPIRDLLVASQTEWRGFIGTIVKAGVGEGVFRADTDARQVAFELIGAGLSYQHALKLLNDPKAKSLAQAAFQRLLNSISTVH
jgi:AcrR family transcriptional regulator